MNNIVNKLLLAGDEFMPVMHLRQTRFTYSAYGLFTKYKKRIKKFKEAGDYLYQSELDKTCFQDDMTYGYFKDLNIRTFPDNVLRNKAFNIAKDPNHDRYLRGLASKVYKLFDKKTSGCGIKNENTSNKELTEELHKPIITKFNKRKVHSPFTDFICGVDLANMQLISKFNKGFRFFLMCY